MLRTRIASNVLSLSRSRWCFVKLLSTSLSTYYLTMNPPIVSVKQGKLQGKVLKSVLGSSYISFQEIPFAAPPIGELRFKDPQPPIPWTGVRDTSKVVGYACPQQREVPNNDIFGDEDCLYLNVYTNSLNQLKPVMFWIHGGAFIVGSGNSENCKPDYLLAKDVVVVTTNYRLGAFGFLNLGDKVAPGNQGLKDLIAALEWVKENIANFGGDPNNVTIFGASAGGALSHSLLLSPRAKGLFHKAIMHSGTVNCTWSLNQSHPERGFKLASILGKNSTDPVEVVEFLRTVPAYEIVAAQPLILTPEESASYKLVFGINNDEIAENPVLPLSLDNLSKGADIPVIIGHTSEESIMFVKDKSEKALNSYNHFLRAHVKNLASLKKLGEEEIEQLLQDVKDYYFHGKPVSEENILGLIKFLSEVYFAIPSTLLLEQRLEAMSAPNYFFRFSYTGNEKTPTDLLMNRIVCGASHVDDIAYLFYLPRCKVENPEPPAVGTKDRITLERMTKMWTDFAKTGNPTPSQDKYVNIIWKPATKNEFCYLEIGDELKFQPIPPHILDSRK